MVYESSDNDLFKLQVTLLSTLLNFFLLNSKSLVKYEYEEHQNSLDSSQKIAKELSGRLTNMRILDAASRLTFREEFDTILQ